MKKFVLYAAAVLCSLAIAAPVLADVTVGGRIGMDAYYLQSSKEKMAGGLPKVNPTAKQQAYDSWDTLRMNMPQSYNRLWTQYWSDDKTIGGYIELRGGGSRGNTGIGESSFSWDKAWIDWKLTPQFALRIGRQPTLFSWMTQDMCLGSVDGDWVNVQTFGDMYNNTSREGIDAIVKFNDNVSMELAIFDPNTLTTGQTVTIPQIAALGGNAVESNVMPRIDIAFPIKVANFQIIPSGTFLKKSYDQVAAGNDDSLTCWGVALDISAAFGPLTVMAEYNHGQNLYTKSYKGASTYAAATTYTSGGLTKISDADLDGGVIKLSYKVGSAAIEGAFGIEKTSNDGDPNIWKDAKEWDVKRTFYGFQVPISVSKVFTITPAVYFIDYDGSAFYGPTSTAGDTDLGTDTVVGVQFLLIF